VFYAKLFHLLLLFVEMEDYVEYLNSESSAESPSVSMFLLQCTLVTRSRLLEKCTMLSTGPG